MDANKYSMNSQYWRAIIEHDMPVHAKRYDRTNERQYENGKRLIELLEIKEGEYILDLGCGTGQLAEYAAVLVGNNGRVTGIEPVEHRIALARHRTMPLSTMTLRVGSDQDLQTFPAMSFDVVYVNSVFHHITDIRTALLNIRRVLRPGGRLGISDPGEGFPPVLQIITREVLQSFGITPHEDNRVTEKELRHLVTSAGFEIIRFDQINNPRPRATRTPREIIDSSEASRLGNFLIEVPEKLNAEIRARIEKKLQDYLFYDDKQVAGVKLFLVAKKTARYHG